MAAPLMSAPRPTQTFTLGAAQTLKADGMVNIAGHFVSQGTISLKVSKTGGFVTNDNIKLTVGLLDHLRRHPRPRTER